MPNLRDIRNRITSVNNTQQITKAMKMVAAAKLRKAQNRMIENRPYAGKLREVAGRLAEAGVFAGEEGSLSGMSPLLRQPEGMSRVLVIVVASDRGLCGGFNTNLFKMVEGELKTTWKEHLDAGRLDLVCVGRKAVAHFTKRRYSVVRQHSGFFDKLEFATSSSVMRQAAEEFASGAYDAVLIAYNEFKSVISQNRVMEQVLPLSPDTLRSEAAAGASSAAAKADAGGSSYHSDYIFEPDPAALLRELVPLYLNTQLWKAVLESNASEQGARMAAMDNATENAKELERSLRLKYNQARQSAITTEISEIVSGAAALQG